MYCDLVFIRDGLEGNTSFYFLMKYAAIVCVCVSMLNLKFNQVETTFAVCATS